MAKRSSSVLLYAETAEDRARLEGYAAGRGWKVRRVYGAHERDLFMNDAKQARFACARFGGVWWIGGTNLAQLTGEVSGPVMDVSVRADAEEFLTVQDVADRYQVHEDTIYRACYGGKLKYMRVGSKIRIAPSALKEWRKR
jgi:excisionase family DNA binding protein